MGNFESPSSAWCSALAEVTTTPHTKIIHLCKHKDTLKNTRNSHIVSENINLGIHKILETDTFYLLEQAGPNNPEDPSNETLKILVMGSISSRKHEMEIWQFSRPRN